MWSISRTAWAYKITFNRNSRETNITNMTFYHSHIGFSLFTFNCKIIFINDCHFTFNKFIGVTVQLTKSSMRMVSNFCCCCFVFFSYLNTIQQAISLSIFILSKVKQWSCTISVTQFIKMFNFMLCIHPSKQVHRSCIDAFVMMLFLK